MLSRLPDSGRPTITGPAESCLLTVDNAGTVTGTAFGDNIKGFWDAGTGKLVFYRAVGVNINGPQMAPNTTQVFRGYMFPCTTPGLRCLAGTFEAFTGTGANKQRHVFGWYAQSLAN